MKTFINNILFALLILFAIFILGMTPSMLVSILISVTTDATFQDCVITVPFWIFTFIGWITSAVYVNEEVNKINNNEN